MNKNSCLCQCKEVDRGVRISTMPPTKEELERDKGVVKITLTDSIVDTLTPCQKESYGQGVAFGYKVAMEKIDDQ